jgi:hypothetical protein
MHLRSYTFAINVTVKYATGTAGAEIVSTAIDTLLRSGNDDRIQARIICVFTWTFA